MPMPSYPSSESYLSRPVSQSQGKVLVSFCEYAVEEASCCSRGITVTPSPRGNKSRSTDISGMGGRWGVVEGVGLWVQMLHDTGNWVKTDFSNAFNTFKTNGRAEGGGGLYAGINPVRSQFLWRSPCIYVVPDGFGGIPPV